ncbi:MAG: Patatin [Myxococcaceae bacterium]|nr:Patatin [Myxococcaceae bacterium]
MKTALVLGGGGARGAYEAGVLSYLRDELGPRLGRPVPLDILCGTSVGAINACILASTAHRPGQQGVELRGLWSQLTVGQVLQLGVADLGRALWELGGGGLFNPAGLRSLMLQHVDWPAIGRNLRGGALSALSVSTTRLSDGKTCLFVQQAPPAQSLWAQNPQFDVVPARIGPRHAIASAAMPLLFAPVELEDQLHVDGGLRLNVPLSPALHLGAQRVIVISMQPKQAYAIGAPHEPLMVTASFLAGKALNALMHDRTEQDVGHLQELNAIVEAGVEALGPGFNAAVNRRLIGSHRRPLRFVRNLVVRPSRDLGVIASRVTHGTDFCRRNHRLPGVLVSLLARSEPQGSADLAAYLLFDPAYAEELIALGRADARSREDEWARFFDDTPINAAEEEQLDRASPRATGEVYPLHASRF